MKNLNTGLYSAPPPTAVCLDTVYSVDMLDTDDLVLCSRQGCMRGTHTTWNSMQLKVSNLPLLVCTFGDSFFNRTQAGFDFMSLLPQFTEIPTIVPPYLAE